MLTAVQITRRVEEAFGGGVVKAAMLEGGHPWVSIGVEHWVQVARFLRDDPQIRLDGLRCITGLDYPDKSQLCAAYDLLSFEFQHEFCVKVFVERPALPTLPEIPSVADIWRAAEWHEREAFDLLGINFPGNPDSVTDEFTGQTLTHPRRILLPDDWVGYPLRKDYQFPKEYEGIPGSVEMDWAQKPNYPK